MSGQSAEIDHFTIDPFLIIGIWNRATDNKKKEKKSNRTWRDSDREKEAESSLKLGREVGGRPTSTIDTRCRTCRPPVQHVCVQIVHLAPRVSASTCNSVVVTRVAASLASCETNILEILRNIANAKQLSCRL